MTDPATAHAVTLSNGIKMPMLGLGVFQSPLRQTADAVRAAISAGYRLIDTASTYRNERAVGEGLRDAGMARKEVFVTTKVFPSQYGFDSTLRAFDDSLRRLGLDYLDLYLLHWPVPMDFARSIETYRAAEKILAEGRVRAIGVSNFEPDHLERLLATTQAKPVVNQVELHPFFTQQRVREANRQHGIVTQAWSPIGGVYGRNLDAVTPTGATSPIDHPTVTKIAGEHGKTPAQVVLRWHLQHGTAVIPKSVNPSRIVENADIFDFALAAGEVERIDSLDTGVRAGTDPEKLSATTFSVDIDDQ